MKSPSDLSKDSEILLAELSFNLTDSQDNGMGKFYEWTNDTIKLLLLYDRGYYECEVLPFQKPINSMGLIRLLRFLKNDKTFYKDELIKANLWYTLTANEYVELFFKNYTLIKDFLISYNQEKFDNYNNFEFSFDGI